MVKPNAEAAATVSHKERSTHEWSLCITHLELKYSRPPAAGAGRYRLRAWDPGWARAQRYSPLPEAVPQALVRSSIHARLEDLRLSVASC